MINKVILIGNAGQAAETKELSGGSTVTNVSLATSESYKDQSGQWQQKTEWHRIVFWGKQAERAAQIAKGATLYVQGKLTHRKWEDKEGQTRSTTEVVANYFRLMPTGPMSKSDTPKPEPEKEPKAEEEETDDLPF